ncbi:homocysteine S-methyltransferase [Acidipila rosea]|uniref:S-methylmethionine:homocysteine methyltransferase n=1 Tax=Acidipila rosea TaxID=768535 RepID=A0A4R1L1S6_9BACT|nr:homocysteine S-methyltransferase [Acidipila rosea]TCK71928.1 homocysteine S-methyltransferase [Acidipila rosea]
MTPLRELDFGFVHVVDGGMATELERRGADISGTLWSAHVLETGPELIETVHRDYLAAGADCILTASYQVSRMGFAEVGFSAADADRALGLAVELAVRARNEYERETGRHALVGASLGPYGAALHNGAEYHGNYACSFADLVRFHGQRLQALASSAADFVAFETIPSLEEAGAILESLHSHPAIGAWISFTCRNAAQLVHGEQLAEVAAILSGEPQVVAVGVNCTHPELMLPLIHILQAASAKPIVVYPNSGEGWDAARRCWMGISDVAGYGELARQWFEAGAQAVGGCCRTTPEHISAVRAAAMVGAKSVSW